MRQNVNLYQQEFKVKKIWLSFKEGLYITFAFIALIFWYTSSLNKSYEQISTSNELLADKVDTETDRDPVDGLLQRMKEKRDVVEEQIKTLTHEVERKKTIKSAYEGNRKYKVASFYDMFVKISEFSNNKLSIDEVGIYDGGNEIIINGYSKDKEQVPLYLKNLKNEKFFESGKFGLLNMQRIDNTEVYRFEMQRREENG
jgi:Tfp pilus assembly protein PilN